MNSKPIYITVCGGGQRPQTCPYRPKLGSCGVCEAARWIDSQRKGTVSDKKENKENDKSGQDQV